MTVNVNANYYKLFSSYNNVGYILAPLYNIFYWKFVKALFRISKTDGVMNKMFNWVFVCYILLTLFGIMGKAIPSSFPSSFFVFTLLTIIPYGVSFYLFYFLIKYRNRFISLLFMSGLIFDNVLSFYFQIDVIRLSNGQSSQYDSFTFLIGYVIEICFLSLVLAFNTNEVYKHNKSLEINLSETKLTALRAQMNPHFIHNSLNAVNRFILNNETEAANHYLTKFSRLIRDVLNHNRENLITIAAEIKTLKLYVELESLRFDNQFKFKLSIPDDKDLERMMVPPLLLQPYVENAIYHGLMSKLGDKSLIINISNHSDYLLIIIEDNGIGRQESALQNSMDVLKEKSLGTIIAQERIDVLNLLSGKKIDVSISDVLDNMQSVCGTKVTIKMFK